jgi:hypothetical protein
VQILTPKAWEWMRYQKQFKNSNEHNMIDEKSMKKVSRRRFLRGATVAVPGIAAASALNA